MTREELLSGLKDIIEKSESMKLDVEDIISDLEDLIEEYDTEEK